MKSSSTQPHVRMIVFTWQLGQITDDRGRVCTGFAEPVVSHPPATNAFEAGALAALRTADPAEIAYAFEGHRS